MQRTRQLASLGARLSAIPLHSRPFVASAPALQEASEILFPRESAGVNYALNWALARTGITPAGEAVRNLPLQELKNRGASPPEVKTGVEVYVKGSGVLTKGKFSKLFKEITAQISRSPTVYVQDGAIGSASKMEARTRVISDTPKGALSLSSLLSPTPTRDISAEAYPLNVYIVSSLKSSVLESSNFVAVDLDSASVFIVGSAVGDKSALKSAFSSVSTPIIFESGSLPLPARLLAEKDTSVLLIAPESVTPSLSSLSHLSLSPDVGVVWSERGVGRVFPVEGKEKTSPNLYSPPRAVALVTSDSTGAIPPVSEISPKEAGYYFLAGFDGKNFTPTYTSQPSSLPPLSLAQKFSEMLTKTKIPVYLINASEGGKIISAKDMEKLVTSAATHKLPKGSKPDEEKVSAFKAKVGEFLKGKFGDLPESIAL